MRRIISVLMALIIMVASLSAFSFAAQAETYAQKLKNAGFPDSYISSLVSLHNKYPNWTFTPFKTGLSWSEAVAGERKSHKNQIIETSGRSSAYFCNCSSCYKNGSYVVPYSGCRNASEWAVKYYMDPRNFLDEKHIFQFESNKYASNQTQTAVESILSGTWMKNANITFVNTSGVSTTYKLDGSAVKYSKAIMNAAKDSGLSPYYLASRIVKEVGSTKPTASGTCGTKSPFNGIYNYYSIGASSGGMSGLEWASGYMKTNNATTLFSSYDSTKKTGSGTKTSVKSGQYMSYITAIGDYYKVKLYSGSGNSFTTNGATGYILKSACRTTYFNYSRPWINPYRSIYGGASYIGANYKYQYTNYLQKFNVNKSSGNLYSHEYMQNVDAPSKEAEYTYKAYSNAGMLSSARTFYIPVYNSMPSSTKTNNGDFGKLENLKLYKNSATSVTIAWNTQYSSSGYYVYGYNPSTKKCYHIATIKSPKTNAYTINNLTPGTIHYYVVESYKGSTYGGRSSILKTITAPNKVNFKSLTSPKAGRLKSTWSKTNGASGYQIKYSRNSKFTKVVATKNLKSSYSTYTGKGFNKGVTYYIKVRAYKTLNGKKYYGSWSKVKKVKSK